MELKNEVAYLDRKRRRARRKEREGRALSVIPPSTNLQRLVAVLQKVLLYLPSSSSPPPMHTNITCTASRNQANQAVTTANTNSHLQSPTIECH